MKVYELAKDLKLKSVDLLDKLRKEHNMSFKNHMQSLNDEDVEKIKSFFSKKNQTSSPLAKKSTVIRRKKNPVQKEPGSSSEKADKVEIPVIRSGVIRRRVQKVALPQTNITTGVETQSKTSPLLQQVSAPVEKKEEVPTTNVSANKALTSRHILPGLVADESQSVLEKINEIIDTSDVEKKKVKKTVEKETQAQQFRATDFRKREVIFQPKKKRPVSDLSIKKTQITTPKSHKRLIKMYDSHISIEDLSKKIGVKKKFLLHKLKQEKLLPSLDVPSSFDCETTEVIASLFGFEVKNMVKNKEEVIKSLFFGDFSAEKKSKPPVVTVMGHVNHGKTTLLDCIRKSRVASQEAGGITQHIGAYSIPVSDSYVTFIDTPGHAAFTSMRARGAKITDIVVIVVSADDGVQPQTIEAINHAKAAKVPIIVAINKVDLPTSNIDQAKKQLTEHELIPEDWGGDTIFCPISALKGDGIKELLEHIQLLAEVHELKANPDRSATGVVIENRMEKGRGWVMTLLVQDGTLKSGQILIADNKVGRVRQMTNDIGHSVSSVGPGLPVEISGFSQAAQVGEPFYVVKNEKEARRLIAEQKSVQDEKENKLSMEELLLKTHTSTLKTLNIVLKTDVAGSREAIQSSIEDLNTEKVEVKVIHANIGSVNESDVLLASTGNAVLLCFNVAIDPAAQKLIKKESVTVQSYTVIYDLLKNVEQMMAGLLDPEIVESFGGRAEVQQVFPISNVGVIAGCKVLKGKIAGDHLARLIRKNDTIYEGKINSLKRFKQLAKEVSEGQECGIGLSKCKDLKPGDIIESFTQKEIKKETLS
ncbi:MAG: translation initiation factor IF-2 [Bdellovibrionales bacterium]|nr:translation initiation factor IF-2 [Bdellovibrionales bacterium]